MKIVIFCLIALCGISAHASLRDVKQLGQTYAWLKPDTPVTYKKNACGGSVYERGYLSRGTYSEAQNSAYGYFYKGGHCTLTKSITDATPATFPQSYAFNDYLKLNPGEDHQVQKHEYHCVSEDGIDYAFEFDLEPVFQCTGHGCYEETPNCIGDLVARYLDIPGVHGFGHTGMYAGDKVLEIISEDQEIVQLNPIAEFKGKTTYWGSGYNAARTSEDHDPELDYEASVNMVETGLKQKTFFPEYTLAPIYKEGRFYIKNNQIGYEKGLFRCDTYVKYLYKKVLNTDIPPYNIYQVPFHQWKAFSYKRNPPNNPGHEPSVAPADLTFAAHHRGSHTQAAAQLIAEFPHLKTQADRLRTFDSVSVLYSRESFMFLLEQYELISDTQTKLRVLSPIRYQYLHYQDDPSFAKLVSRVRDIYQGILDRADNPALVKRAIEDITIVFDSKHAAHHLKAFDASDKRYRSAYLTSSSIAHINNGDGDELLDIIASMNGCEVTDRMALFGLAHEHHLLSDPQFEQIRDHFERAEHEPDCVHQHVDNLRADVSA